MKKKVKKQKNNMIPKIIYYTWVSDKPLPAEFKPYIDHWREVMPNYDIRHISLENCPRNAWVNKAIENKQFVLAGHYARCQNIYETGGIYFDIDVEVLKSFDPFLNNNFFLGQEDDNTINNAVFGSVEGHPFLLECMKYMDNFPLSHPQVPNETGPRMFTKLMKKRGWEEGVREGLFGDIKLYNKEYFYPYNWNEEFAPDCITNKTHAIHRWAATWTK